MKKSKGVFTLIKVLLHNAEMRLPQEGNRKTFYTALGVIAVACIMLPCCFVVGYISYMMTKSLQLTGGDVTGGLLAEVHIMSAFSMIFGILVIFNVLFFSSDREHLVPLPLKAEEILAAKFFYAFFAESVMEFMVLLSMFVGFVIADGPAPMSIISGLIGTVVIPLIPLTYCAILSILLMAILKNVKSTKVFGQISTLLLLVFVGLFLLSFKGMGKITVENFVGSIADGSNLFVRTLNKIFFVSPLLMKGIQAGNVLYLLLYLVCNVALVALMLGIGHFLYQEGLFTVARLGGGKKKKAAALGKKKSDSVFASCVKKEWRVLIRTKAYRINCVMVNFLWPVAVLVLFLTRKEGGTFAHILDSFQQGQDWPAVLYTVILTAVGFIASAMNSVASTSFTREGAHLSLVKYIPVDYRTQMKAKAYVAIMISFVPVYMAAVIARISMGAPIYWYLFDFVILLAVIVFTTILGMILDSTAPHSAWDDEYSALRGNLNTFFNMAIVMVTAMILCGGGFLLYYHTSMNGLIFHVGLAVTLLLIVVISGKVGTKKILQNMEIM
ncbi:MAG: hypothetical protein MJ105_02255 [Lachnospiraceae bacterium]|nr:hypothetical protein [Lachnospiraceae bacterium]